jgi:hypothetical protein
MAFKKGCSGNSKGRPRSDSKAASLRATIQDALPSIVDKLILLAEDGDLAAMKLLVDKGLPTPKPQVMSIVLPATGTLASKGDRIIKAMMAGELAPDVGSQLLSALHVQAGTIDMTDVAQRLERIEKQLESKQ